MKRINVIKHSRVIIYKSFLRNLSGLFNLYGYSNAHQRATVVLIIYTEDLFKVRIYETFVVFICG